MQSITIGLLYLMTHAPKSRVESLIESQGFSPSGVTVAQCVGPQFESPSEIIALEKLGADTVGMTLGPESRLIWKLEYHMLPLHAPRIGPLGRTETQKSPIDHHSVDKLASSMRARISSCDSSSK